MIVVTLFSTGGERYDHFVPNLVASLKQFFPPHDVILFTDNPSLLPELIHVPQESLGWPRASLMRYHALTKQQGLLSKYDHIFFLDTDMIVKAPVTETEICGDGITAVLHPGFAGVAWDRPYDRTGKSTASLQGNKEYYQGCLQGGSTEKFLNMCAILRDNIDKDDDNGVMASWFDESHLNHYLFNHPPTITLSPLYAFPECPEAYPAVLGQEPRIVHLAKEESWKW